VVENAEKYWEHQDGKKGFFNANGLGKKLLTQIAHFPDTRLVLKQVLKFQLNRLRLKNRVLASPILAD